MSFHVGQKVVCINANPSDRGIPSGLVKDRVYVVSEVIIFGRHEGVRLQGAPLPDVPRTIHLPGWKASRFRPVIERKTDISVFQKMLIPTDKVSA